MIKFIKQKKKFNFQKKNANTNKEKEQIEICRQNVHKDQIELDYLIMQRNQLVEALSVTNDTYRKTMLGFIGSMASIALADFFNKIKESFNYKAILLILIQVIILFAIYIEVLLISGNTKRYYICAIDDYIRKKYKVSCLFYQGRLCSTHTIGLGSKYSNTSFCFGIAFIVFFSWFLYEFELIEYVINNHFYMLLICVEFIGIIYGLEYNINNKYLMSKNKMNEIGIYKDCIDFLKENN